jgi:hypothetical protein
MSCLDSHFSCFLFISSSSKTFRYEWKLQVLNAPEESQLTCHLKEQQEQWRSRVHRIQTTDYEEEFSTARDLEESGI